jgi:hypothetical protein
MEAIVRSGTGLLPAPIENVVLRNLEDGRWQARCDFGRGRSREYEFPADDQLQRRLAGQLQDELGFTAWCADETARRLIEPFALAAEWGDDSWPAGLVAAA